MKQYYYLNAQGQQMPPVDFESLRNAGINADTMVWFEGLAGWMRAGDIPELQPIVGSVPPPIGTPGVPPHAGAYQQPYRPAYQPYQQPGPGMPVKPQSYLWLGICTTLLCCLPAGIVSIVYASKVDTMWNRGMYDEAVENSEKAKTWGIVSAVAGAVFCFIFFCIGLAS